MSNSNEKLEKAVLDDDYHKVRTLLYGGANANYRTTSRKNKTLLHGTRNVEITRELLLHGARVNSTNEYSETPLYFAITKNKKLELVRELLKHGAYVNASSLEFREEVIGDTALNFAVKQRRENLDIINLLLQYGADINIRSHTYDSYSTPLGNAAKLSNRTMVKILIKITLIKHLDIDHEQIINLDPYRHSSRFIEMYCYREECISELRRLKIKKIVGNLSIYDFLKTTNLYLIPAQAISIIKDQELLIHYPVYRDVILEKLEACIKRGSLFNILRKIEFYTRLKTPTNQDVEETKVVLNFDSTYIIVKYISNDDLENFITAFYKGTSPLDFSDNGILIQPEETLGGDYGNVKRSKLDF